MFPDIHTQRFALYPSTNRRVCCRLDSRAFPRARLRRCQAPFRASAASRKMKYIGCDIESNRSIRYDPKVYMERKTCREHPSLRDLRSEPKSRSGVGGAGPLASTSTRSFYRPFGLMACFYGTVRYCSRYRVVVAEQARSAKRQLGFSVFPPYSTHTKDQTGSEYVLYIRPLGAVYGWIRLARTSPSRRRGRVRAGRIRPYTATRGLI